MNRAMEDERAVTHEREETPTVRCRLLIGLMRVLLRPEANHSGWAGLSDEAFPRLAFADTSGRRRKPRPTNLDAPHQIGRASPVMATTKSDSDRRIHAKDSVARLLHYTPGRSCRVPRTLPTNRDGSLPVHVAR
jgi:hypothetical protein